MGRFDSWLNPEPEPSSDSEGEKNDDATAEAPEAVTEDAGDCDPPAREGDNSDSFSRLDESPSPGLGEDNAGAAGDHNDSESDGDNLTARLPPSIASTGQNLELKPRYESNTPFNNQIRTDWFR